MTAIVAEIVAETSQPISLGSRFLRTSAIIMKSNTSITKPALVATNRCKA
jgi:hypothetical protein